jgi:hypothetical protein
MIRLVHEHSSAAQLVTKLSIRKMPNAFSDLISDPSLLGNPLNIGLFDAIRAEEIRGHDSGRLCERAEQGAEWF